jgi:predicted enzyme related to lactoylglutathione lyase
MFLGLRTCQYFVPKDKLGEATAWYTRLTGTFPNFEDSSYVGFTVGGFELGLLAEGGSPGPGGTIAYWGADDVRAEVDRLVGLGATIDTRPRDVGDGILIAVVVDPFGNQLGVIQNPHFKTEDVK